MSELLNSRINEIVKEGRSLVDKYFLNENLTLDYVAIFSQNADEYNSFNGKITNLGKIYSESSTGNTYILDSPIQTVAGPVKLVKIRKPDETRPQLGAPDFKVANYNEFKDRYKNLSASAIVKASDGVEIFELRDNNFNVLVYIPSRPLSEDVFK